jgi:phage terminase large subunit GpA-like protein
LTTPNIAAELADFFYRQFAPPPEITVSQWADQHRRLSAESAAEYGQWKTLSFQREPMDAAGDPRVRRVVIKSCTQLLKTVTIENAVAYFIDQDPGPMLIIQPRDKDAKDFSKERLAPMIRDTPRLRQKVSRAKSRNSDNTIEEKHFPGGLLAVTSSGSPGNLARRSIRFLFCDEVDKYALSAGAEGNPVSLARKRLATFRHRAKEIDTCSPTIAGSEIDRGYELSDQREFYVPCPRCGQHQSMMLKFRTQVRWDSNLPTSEEQADSARYHCEHCGAPWTDAERWDAVDRGAWRANKPFAGIAGFWISELYSPWKRLRDIVFDFLTKQDNIEDLKTFIQTSLAENWAEPGEAPEWERLLGQREPYAIGAVPRGGLFLTAGVDVQRENGGRLEVEVVAWGRNRQSWSIDYRIFAGDPAGAEVWQRLEAYRAQLFSCEGGGSLPLERMFVDSGDGAITAAVYEWVRLQPRPQVWAIKGYGKSDPVGSPHAVETTVDGRRLKFGVLFKTVNPDFFKGQLFADLRKRKPTEEELEHIEFPAGYCHMPMDIAYGDEHFKQLCAEQLVSRRDRHGRMRQEYQQMRPRNEALDCRIYAMAAAWDFGWHRFQEQHWTTLERRRAAQATEPPPDSPAATVPAQPFFPGSTGRRPGFQIRLR